MKIDDLSDLATPEDVAAILRCDAKWVRNQCRAGRLQAVKIAGRYLIEGPAAVRKFIEESRVCPNQTVAPSFNGARIERFGKSNGSNEDAKSVAAQVQQIVKSLTGSSPTLSITKTGKGRPEPVLATLTK